MINVLSFFESFFDAWSLLINNDDFVIILLIFSLLVSILCSIYFIFDSRL